MNRALIPALLLSALFSAPSVAALNEGDKAPDFTAQASLAGKAFNYTFKDALKKGPVVVYFYPSAFTGGCAAYKPLHHKPGFLVDGSRIDDGVLEILVDSGSQGSLKNLKVELSNVSPSYYEFNYFYSNESQTGGLLNNPPIAAFNIRIKTAYGSFSALNTEQKLVPIR